jgi:inosose dehydratase
VEGYIFQQYAERRQKPLGEIIPEVLAMAKSAGFTNIELNPAFFAPAIREKTMSLLSSLHFRMPSIYVGGNLHSPDGASKTIDNALQYFRMVAPFGCKALVTNPDPKAGDQQKSDDELNIEAESLNRMGKALDSEGCELRVHHHTPQLENGAREWRQILAHTDPKFVTICVDIDWAYEGGFQPVPFLEEVGPRLREIHVRSARDKIWLEDVQDSDIDYHEVAAYLRKQSLHPLVVVELAYRPQTVVTRSLEDDLRLSRVYTERVLNLATGNHVGL